MQNIGRDYPPVRKRAVILEAWFGGECETGLCESWPHIRSDADSSMRLLEYIPFPWVPERSSTQTGGEGDLRRDCQWKYNTTGKLEHRLLWDNVTFRGSQHSHYMIASISFLRVLNRSIKPGLEFLKALAIRADDGLNCRVDTRCLREFGTSARAAVRLMIEYIFYHHICQKK